MVYPTLLFFNCPNNYNLKKKIFLFAVTIESIFSLQTQLEKLQNEISQIAKKTGISSATKLALIAKSEGTTEDVPQMEWWDSVILVDSLDTLTPDGRIAIKRDTINNLVEHPTQMRCPSKCFYLISQAKLKYWNFKVHHTFVVFIGFR